MSEREALLKATVLGSADGKTQQSNEDVIVYGTPDGAIVPALPPESFQKLSEFNGIRSAIIDVIARNTVGLGYSIEVETGFEKEVTDPTGDIRDVTSTLEVLASRDQRMGGPTFTELLYACKHDEEEIGTGAIEVSRDKRTGEISGLFHVPAVRLRRRKDFTGWFLIPMSGAVDESTPFYNYGEKVQYNGDGTPQGKLAKGKSWDTNEVMVFRIYNSASRDYGLPRDAAMALEHLGDKLSSESNVSFFDSSGVPPTVLFVQGEEQKGPGGQQASRMTFRVPKETTDRIASLLRSDTSRHHKVAVIPVPPGTATNAVQLGVDKTDMGFVNYRNDNKLRTFGVFRVAPVFLSDFINSARYTAEVQRAITLEQVFDPEQNRWQAMLGRRLLTELGYPHLALAFRKLAVEGNAVKRQSAEALAAGQAITRREYRAAHGYGPLPEAKQGEDPQPGSGQVPFGWNDELVVVAKAAGPPGATDQQPNADQRGLAPNIGARTPQTETTPTGDSAGGDTGFTAA